MVARAAAGRAHADALDRVAVTGFVEGDRAAFGAGRQRREPVVEAERACGERRDDRGGEVRTGKQGAAHLLLHHDRVDDPETQPAVALGHEQPRPPEVDDARPQLGRDPGVVVLGHPPHVRARRFGGEKRTHRGAQRFLVRGEREVHGFTVLRPRH